MFQVVAKKLKKSVFQSGQIRMVKMILHGIMPTNNQTEAIRFMSTQLAIRAMLVLILCIFTICWMVREPISQKPKLQSLKSLKLKFQDNWQITVLTTVFVVNTMILSLSIRNMVFLRTITQVKILQLRQHLFVFVTIWLTKVWMLDVHTVVSVLTIIKRLFTTTMLVVMVKQLRIVIQLVLDSANTKLVWSLIWLISLVTCLKMHELVNGLKTMHITMALSCVSKQVKKLQLATCQKHGTSAMWVKKLKTSTIQDWAWKNTLVSKVAIMLLAANLLKANQPLQVPSTFQRQALIPSQVVRQSRQKLRFQAQSWPTMTRAWVLTMTKFWQPMVINGFHTWQQAVPVVTLILQQLKLQKLNQKLNQLLNQRINQVFQNQALIPSQVVRQLRQKLKFQAQN